MSRGFYSLPEPRIFRGASRRANSGSGPDACSPRSPGYAERHRETATEIAHGMIRIDIGEPIKRVAGDAQPVPIGSPALPPEQPVAVEPEPNSFTPRTIASVDLPDWRSDYGLGKSR